MISNQLLKNCCKYLFYIFPILIITGSFLTDLTVILLGLLFIILSIRENNYSYFKNKFSYIFIFFYFVLLFSNFINFTLEGIVFTLVHIRYFFLILCIWYMMDQKLLSEKTLFYICGLIILIFSIDIVREYYSDYNIFGIPRTNSYRIYSFFGDELVSGFYLCKISILTLFFFNKSFNNQYNFIFEIIFIILISMIIFLTGERASFALFIIFVFFYFSLNRISIIIKFTSILVLISVIFFSQNYIEKSINRMIFQTIDEIKLTESKLGFFGNHHEAHIFSALKMFNENKIIGVGSNNFRKLCNEKKYIYSNSNYDGCSTHPHNIYIQMLAENGIFGFLALFLAFTKILSLIFICLKKKIKGLSQNNDHYLIILIASMISLWPFVPTYNFFNNWLMTLNYLPIGFLIYYLSSLPKQNQ